VELSSGTTLLGKYRVEEILGTGGMGRVVRAAHLYLNQPVAIKILLPQMAENAETVSRFLREGQSAANLRSEHIARVFDVGMIDHVPYMVMEYLDGNDLNQILRHHGPQSPPIVCDLMLQACEGIAEAHALGIVHRDIKPSNFFITRKPDGSMLLKILDFGISKTPVNITELTGTQTVIGTPTYMAPEQMKSGRSADARSDIWSMGIVMYQLLSGRPPFLGESYAELVFKVGADAPPPIQVPLPAGLGELIFRCLEKDPRQRQQNVGELARMLAPFASDPIAAAQSAARTTRILQTRASSQGMQGLPVTAGGGLSGPGPTTPAPLSPAQLTPMSWPPGSTSTHGRGQLTYKTRSGRGWVIAGAAVLCIIAGSIGFLISSYAMDKKKPAAAATTTATTPPPPPTTTTTTTTPPPPPATTAKTEAAPPKTETAPAKTETAPAKTETTPPKTETKSPPPTTTVKTETKPKTETKSPPPTTTAKTETKPKTETKSPPSTTTKKKPKSGDDLFDTRH
jgi:serine/threonine protein kinase